MFGYWQSGSTRPDNVSVINLSRYWARTANGALIDIESGSVLADPSVIFTSWFIVYRISEDVLYCVVNSNLVGIRSDIECTTKNCELVTVINGDTTLRNSMFRPTVEGGMIIEPNIIYTNHTEGVLKINTHSTRFSVGGTAPCTVNNTKICIPLDTLPMISFVEWQVLTNSDLDVISTPESNLKFKFVIIKS